MGTTRRNLLKAAVGAAFTASKSGGAKSSPPSDRVITAVMQGDLRVFDPIWSSANITSYHSAMVYDTLFGIDAEYRPRPQMVSKYDVSQDRSVYTFVLREGLAFSDGTSVTSRDCIASIRRWAARDGAGQHLFQRVKDTRVVDEKTFQIVLSEPYSLIIDWLAKPSPNVCYIMREKEALTDPNQQIETIVGSGPFVFNEDAVISGQRYVYDRNERYLPRAEPASFSAGGKVVNVDRVIFENIADEATAIAALGAGEVDFIELPNVDLLPSIANDPRIKIDVLDRSGQLGFMRLNFLHPPFDNVKARRAMLHLIHATDIMRATFGDAQYFKGCGSFFGCGTPMENDANTEWFKQGQNMDIARKLIRESGYDGRPVVLLQATNFSIYNNAASLTGQWMKEAGFNVQLVPLDWGAIATRRSVKSPPDQGGWNIFFTSASTYSFNNPVSFVAHSALGEKSWVGWPRDERHEQLRDAWAKAADETERKAIAREIQANAWDFVPHIYYGQWVQPSAHRGLEGLIGMPELIPFWNVRKT